MCLSTKPTHAFDSTAVCYVHYGISTQSPLVSGFSSKNLGLQVQKKFATKFATKGVVKHFIDDELGTILDKMYQIATQETDSKKAHKLVKDLIKIIVKLGLLYRNNQFNPEELRLGEEMRRKLKKVALTVISFYEVDFTYDRAFLVAHVKDLGDQLHRLVDRHLKAKSHARIDNVIQFFANGDILDKVFASDGKYRPMLPDISKGFSLAVEKEW